MYTCVTPTNPRRPPDLGCPYPASYRNCGTWVVLPEPVSPHSRSTSLSLIWKGVQRRRRRRWACRKRRCFSAWTEGRHGGLRAATAAYAPPGRLFRVCLFVF